MTEFVSGSGSAHTPGASGWDGHHLPGVVAVGRAGGAHRQGWGCPWTKLGVLMSRAEAARGQVWDCPWAELDAHRQS